MSLLNGSLPLRRFLVIGPHPDSADLASSLAAEQFRTFQDGLEEERLGWCDWRNPLHPQDPHWIENGDGWATFGLRIDTRRVPAGLLKAHVDERLDQLRKEKDLAFVGKEARVSLADEVKVELLRRVLPSMAVSTLCWNLKEGTVLTDASSSKTQSALVGLFLKSFGAELQMVGPLVLAGRVDPGISVEALMALDPLNLEVSNG